MHPKRLPNLLLRRSPVLPACLPGVGGVVLSALVCGLGGFDEEGCEVCWGGFGRVFGRGGGVFLGHGWVVLGLMYGFGSVVE